MKLFAFALYLFVQTALILQLFFGSDFSSLSVQFCSCFFVQTILSVLFFFFLIHSSPGSLQPIDQNHTQKADTLSSTTSHSIEILSHPHLQPYQTCDICQIPKQLRSFHCSQCNTCIPTYDHHCPYIGKCIGQKNRLHFFLFLLFQTTQSFHLLLCMITLIIETGNRNNKIIGLLSLSLVVFAVIGFFLLFETYCMLFNITMQQFLFRKETYYLANQTRTYPFSDGFFVNIIQFFGYPCRQDLIKWSIKQYVEWSIKQQVEN